MSRAHLDNYNAAELARFREWLLAENAKVLFVVGESTEAGCTVAHISVTNEIRSPRELLPILRELVRLIERDVVTTIHHSGNPEDN